MACNSPEPIFPPSLEIPVIDISGYLRGEASATSVIASSFASAARAPGFFQITGHNVSPALIARLLARLAAFFALPLETKNSIHRNKSSALRGFEAVGEQRLEEGFSDCKEGFMVGPERSAEGARFLQGPNQWLEETEVEGLKEVVLEYFSEMRALSGTMFRLIALSLGVDEHYFDEFATSRDSIANCRAHRYPPASEEVAKNSRGIGAHTDFGALTLLLQDKIGGLEVFHRPTQTWHPVQALEGAFVVNVGDMLERWTNNHYASTLHRVISPTSGQYRYSVAFFNEGLLDQLVECIPTCLKQGDIPLYEPVLVETHLRDRYGKSY
ncbi:hypothetical protein LTR56_005775 [Elasticomyces elasticus]|nr:hypothetical protein LTR56_005775 [Elasticomyces elasticus]KAK4925706.1 hypothetical protein LTR49_007316 [Elasticomyces elasticus]KAK5765037.1 hypothetical protein LTS12_004815 [Elasticomyces elasticus]